MQPGGRVAILDVDVPLPAHTTPHALLSCEHAAVGYREAAWHWIQGRSVYLAVFEPLVEASKAERIVLCGHDRSAAGHKRNNAFSLALPPGFSLSQRF